MGIPNCRHICQGKLEEDKLDIINYNENSNNMSHNQSFNSKTGLSNSQIYQKYTNDIEYSKFKKMFEERLPLIGRYISIQEFEALIPEDVRKYMIENILDISKYLSLEKTYEIKPIEFNGGNVYRGNWNEQLEMEGYGQYYLKDEKVLAEGVWKEGCLIFARVFLPNGDLYEGGFQNSIFNGQGKLKSSNGEIYEGNFVNGEKNGLCTNLFPDGTVFNGQMINGFFDGEGNIKWNNGIQYYGNFSHSTLCGYGTLTSLDGEKYEGYFEKNLFNGRGKFTFDNGDFYEGNFEKGRKRGKGVYRRNDGLIFEGEWIDDYPHGLGKIIYGAMIFKCTCINGKIMELVNEQGVEYGYQYDIILDFKPEESLLYAKLLPHLEYENIQISQYGLGALPSFLDE